MGLNEYHDYENEEVNNDVDKLEDGDVSNPHYIMKHLFRELITWSQFNFIYSPPPREFVDVSSANTNFRHIPSFIQLFSLFWLYVILYKIVVETNWYATTPNDNGSAL